MFTFFFEFPRVDDKDDVLNRDARFCNVRRQHDLADAVRRHLQCRRRQRLADQDQFESASWTNQGNSINSALKEFKPALKPKACVDHMTVYDRVCPPKLRAADGQINA